ncbi:rhodanese-related sulfurtransferase [Hasllibacter halocynthiae]|uniref:Rhodanese-related sulfurtransferase n=1 Tax=Hasllibacter halocynthiae TaxID=595589 RepID=A0A2T0X1Y3_9RHOB|nr:rhodanese-like domain-containing protein [Hasllibacter halocynthiae]PRY92927.1 rhodanese-related sulfurtransferase [Hasllibacter halocynthiae]
MRTERTERGTLETWTPEEVRAGMERGEVVLVDVRTPQEYALEHVPGALLMPMQEVGEAVIPGDPDGQRVVFHCAAGARSGKVAEVALARGRGVAAHMEGGFGAWKGAKLPTVAIDPATGAPKGA